MQQYPVYSQDQSFMQIRLETKKHLDDIREFISGKRKTKKTVWNGETPTDSYEWQQTGEPMMNEKGVQAIMMKVSSIIDPSIVQGNLPTINDLKEFIGYFRQDLNDSMMYNFYKWDISLSNYHYILDFVIDKTRLFLTRLIGNKERESYATTMRMHEINRIETPENKSRWNIPLFKQ